MAAGSRYPVWVNALIIAGFAGFMTYFVLRPIIVNETVTYLFIGGVNLMFLMNCFK